MVAKFYVIVRNDMPSMNAGKMAAQVSHCTTKMCCEIDDFVNVSPFKNRQRKWLNDENIGTTIIMQGIGQDIKRFFALVKKEFPYLYTNKVIDETYPFLVHADVTEWLDDKTFIDWGHLDTNGLVKCYHPAWTCSGLFFDGTPKEAERIKELMEECDINLM